MGLTLLGTSADTEVVSDPVKLVIGRFEDLIARGLRSLLAEDPNIEVVATDVEIEQLEALLTEHEPTVALINFGSLRTPVEVNRLRVAHPETRLLVLANRPTPSECSQMLAFGATACLSKETQARDILNAIHLASRGLHVLPRTDSDAGSESLGPELLTPREADVLEHLRAGRSNAEIALALSVSVETIRTHRRNIYRKLGVRTRRELASLT
jgi:two-component system, NarL family, nitrate/nitrite response regulator NarL